MNRPRILTLSVITLITLVIAITLQRNFAAAQSEGKAAVKWEYKVIGSLPTNSKEAEEEFGRLGNEGWECIGAASRTSGGGGAISTTTFIIFKRQKQ